MIERTSIFDGQDQSWVRDYLKPRYPELVSSYLEASKLYRGSKKRRSVNARALDKLLSHATNPRTPVGENVASMIGELYDIDESVEVAIRKLAGGGQVHERINALVALDSCRTTKLHDELLAELLVDRSARVRALAADKIVGHGLRTLLSKLREAHRREEKKEVKTELEADIEYLTKGMHVRWSRRVEQVSKAPNKSLERTRER